MWTVIYIASGSKQAEAMKAALEKEGFLVKIRPVSGAKNQYEILVPAGELEEAKEVLPALLQLSL